ncbi:MAG TPA: hypothetical protein VK768_07885, partial [Chthoniobacterales bacterium]|nr:hypothetical protein [Chthoniobacterales bacterium]
MKDSTQEPIRSLGSPLSEDWWNPQAGQELLILEDPTVRAVFDAESGAWIDYQQKRTGWKIQKRTELGQSFRAYATWKDRLFNPVSGLSCRLRQSTVDAAGQQISFKWDQLRTAGGIELAVSLSTQVQLEQGRLTFSGSLQNASDAKITT